MQLALDFHHYPGTGGSRIKYHIRGANIFSRAAHQVTPEFPTNLRKIQKEYDTNLLQVIIYHRLSTYRHKSSQIWSHFVQMWLSPHII
jgi:hypothetical protein